MLRIEVFFLTGCFALFAILTSETTAGEQTIRGDSKIIPRGAVLETIWEEGGFTEGAAAAPDGTIYFSDFGQPFNSRPARVMHFDPLTGKINIHVHDSRMANGLMFDRQGNLYACCASPLGGLRALALVRSDGTMQPVITHFQGKQFNSPNDLVIDREGRIYFSDPKYVGPEKMALSSMDVYRYDPNGSLTRVTNDISKPNGVILSPDGKTLYVAETDNGTDEAERVTDAEMGRMTLNAFSVQDDGSLGQKRVLINFGDQVGIDGMTVDQQGRVYAAVRSANRFGIAVFEPHGKELAFIPTPHLPTNCCFGRSTPIETKTLYITAGSGLYRVRLKTTGHHSAVVAR